MNNDNYRLQFITHYNEKYSYIDSAVMALEGGCRWIQLRMKDSSEEIMEETALIIQEKCKEYGATFIIDDNVFLAKKIKADGVHLGKKDMPIEEARTILGDDFIIGGTVNTFEDIDSKLTNKLSQPDYFGCGPFRFTNTKQNLAPLLGLESYKKILSSMNDRQINIPLIAIGGITKDDIKDLLNIGVSGIALSGSIINAENPVEEMKETVKIITNNT